MSPPKSGTQIIHPWWCNE